MVGSGVLADDKPAKKSDLPVRAVSAVVMLAVAGTAVWFGGWLWTALVLLVGLGVLWEWLVLVRRGGSGWFGMIVWAIFALFYVGMAAFALVSLRSISLTFLLMIVGVVIATDIGAYFAGRTIGGPKIAPRISPSKTWAGLGGGMVAAALLAGIAASQFSSPDDFIGGSWPLMAAIAAVLAVVAQIGDFFESWLKRRAGVKDSGSLIPGHGGLFDRVDGLLAVSVLAGFASLGFWIMLS